MAQAALTSSVGSSGTGTPLVGATSASQLPTPGSAAAQVGWPAPDAARSAAAADQPDGALVQVRTLQHGRVRAAPRPARGAASSVGPALLGAGPPGPTGVGSGPGVGPTSGLITLTRAARLPSSTVVDPGPMRAVGPRPSRDAEEEGRDGGVQRHRRHRPRGATPSSGRTRGVPTRSRWPTPRRWRGRSRRLAEGWRVVVVHGNGPQVGNLAIQAERGQASVPAQPLFSLDAMTQGQLGSMISPGPARGVRRAPPGVVVAIVTHVVGRPRRPRLRPTRPSRSGRSSPRREAEELAAERGGTVVEDAGRGYRQVVASPQPMAVLEADAVRELRGRRLPSCRRAAAAGCRWPARSTGYEGVEAVIDKDYSPQRAGH